MTDTTAGTPAETSWHRARGGDGRFLRSIDTIDRDRRAAELITQGWTYQQVADHLGYADKGTCHHAVRLVRHEAAQLTGTSEDMRRDQLAALAEQKRRLWDQINNPAPLVDRLGRVTHDDDGNVIYDAQAVNQAHALLIQVSKREAAIRGTDAPKRSVSLTGTVGVAEIIAVLEQASEQDFHEAITEMRRRITAKTAEQHRQARAIPGGTEPADDAGT